MRIDEMANGGYITKLRAAEYMSLSIRAVERLIKNGSLPTYGIPLSGTRKKLLLRIQDIDAWMERYRVRLAEGESGQGEPAPDPKGGGTRWLGLKG